MMRVITNFLHGILLLVLISVVAFSGTKTWTNGVGNSRFDVPGNWNPFGVPTSTDSVVIGSGGGDVVVSGKSTVAQVTIQNGGRMVNRKNRNKKHLTVLGDFIVQNGGTFNVDGNPSEHGPIVNIGGDIINNGTWDLTGVGGANEGVVLTGMDQIVSGTGGLVFQNLMASNGFTIDGTTVCCSGTYTGPTPTLINGGGLGCASLPIQLASFGVSFTSTDSVRLEWSTVSETNNYGFEILKSQNRDMTNYSVIGFVAGHGTTILPQSYSFTDESIIAGTSYYRLRQIDLTGETSFSDIVQADILTGVSNESLSLSKFHLSSNYPNPFNPSTEIRFSVDATTNATLTIYNALGQHVGTLFDGTAEAGRLYNVTFDAKDLSSGMYFYRFGTDGKNELKTMVLLK
jgi:hypothetical protein